MQHMTKNLLGLERNEIAKSLSSLNLAQFRLKQIYDWIYVKGALDFSQMSNLSKENRENLALDFNLNRPKINKDLLSSDGTRKWLIEFGDKNLVEAVFIPEQNRGTLCISSQIGCTLACKFCHTGTQTLVRNLDASEIIAQVIIAKDLLGDWNHKPNEARQITNIVFMGMGEPFFNYDNVKKSIEILTDEDGLAFANRRITVSTSGLVPEILKASSELKTQLAISLHATNDKLRTEIMAINKRYPLAELMSACKTYNQQNQGDKITFEYVMLKDVNDKEQHALELVGLIKKYNLNAKINLIPFNPWESCDFVDSGDNQIKKFQAILKKNDLIAPIRKTRGQDAMAACGQLKSESLRLRQGRRAE
jgi:23S rRNA (adenine2503-C2)-methyltransferase